MESAPASNLDSRLDNNNVQNTREYFRLQRITVNYPAMTILCPYSVRNTNAQPLENENKSWRWQLPRERQDRGD